MASGGLLFIAGGSELHPAHGRRFPEACGSSLEAFGCRLIPEGLCRPKDCGLHCTHACIPQCNPPIEPNRTGTFMFEFSAACGGSPWPPNQQMTVHCKPIAQCIGRHRSRALKLQLTNAAIFQWLAILGFGPLANLLHNLSLCKSFGRPNHLENARQELLMGSVFVCSCGRSLSNTSQ